MNDYISHFVNKNCFVTGGAGFIGSNLSRFLAVNGANVVVLDNYSTGRKENTLDFSSLGIKLIERQMFQSSKRHQNISQE
ncbi:MAG: hypothetical protein CM15mP42_08960 [Methanobacteriota archaeon]|nr:MAG: hypothetical protein CM15mP42_08960 [Euryarchaeota archaeon]